MWWRKGEFMKIFVIMKILVFIGLLIPLLAHAASLTPGSYTLTPGSYSFTVAAPTPAPTPKPTPTPVAIPKPTPVPTPIPAATGPIWSTWTDRRPIPALLLTDYYDFSNGNVNGWNWGSVAANGGQAGWANACIAAFKQAISDALAENAQGLIVWDIEGEKGGQSNPAYYGDPQTATNAGIAPEMLQPNAANPPVIPTNQSVADYCFGLIRAAGLKVGVTSRCDLLNSSATDQSQYTSLAQAVADQTRKAKYANARWGATIFYCDSADGANSPADGGQEFAQLHASFPKYLFIPEFEGDGNISQDASGENLFAGSAAPYTYSMNDGDWLDRTTYRLAFTVVAVDRGGLSTQQISNDQAKGDIIMHYLSAQ
jgi:hypothetical protein